MDRGVLVDMTDNNDPNGKIHNKNVILLAQNGLYKIPALYVVKEWSFIHILAEMFLSPVDVNEVGSKERVKQSLIINSIQHMIPGSAIKMPKENTFTAILRQKVFFILQ